MSESIALRGASRGYVLVKCAVSAAPGVDIESFKDRLKDIQAYARDWGEPGDAIAPATLTWREPIEWVPEPVKVAEQGELFNADGK